MRIPKISYAPLIGATNQGYQIQQNKLGYKMDRLNQKIAKQELAFGWAELGLKAATLLGNTMEKWDNEKLRAAKLETVEALDNFTKERLASKNYAWVDETDENGLVVGKRVNWEKMYEDFKAEYADKFTGKDSPFTFDRSKLSYEEFLHDAFKQESMRMTLYAKEQLDAEFKVQADMNLKKAIETDMNNITTDKDDFGDPVTKPDSTPKHSAALIQSWVTDKSITPAQGKVRLDQAGRQIYLGQMDREVAALAQNGDFEGASKIINENKEKMTPPQYNDRQSNIRTWVNEFKVKTEEEFSQVFTNRVLKGQTLDVGQVRAYIDRSNATPIQKAQWTQTVNGFEESQLNQGFNEKLNAPGTWNNLAELTKLRDEIKTNATGVYTDKRLEPTQSAHLEKTENRMRILQSEKDADEREKKAEAAAAARAAKETRAERYEYGNDLAARFYEGVRQNKVTPRQALNEIQKMYNNKELDNGYYTEWNNRIYQTINQEVAVVRKSLDQFFTTEKGELFLSMDSGGKMKKVPLTMEDEKGFQDALLAGMRDGWIKPGTEAEFTKKYFQDKLVGGLQFRDVKGAIDIITPGNLRVTENHPFKYDKADKIRQALANGDFYGKVFIDNGRLVIAPEYKQMIEGVWATDQAEFERITGKSINKQEYKVVTTGSLPDYPGAAAYVMDDSSVYQWVPMKDGNSVLRHMELTGKTTIYDPAKKKWVLESEYMVGTIPETLTKPQSQLKTEDVKGATGLTINPEQMIIRKHGPIEGKKKVESGS